MVKKKTDTAEIRGVRIAPGVKAPLLIIHDEDDVDVPLRDGKAYVEAWPGARLHTTRSLGHRRILRDPEVIGAVADFLAAD